MKSLPQLLVVLVPFCASTLFATSQGKNSSTTTLHPANLSTTRLPIQSNGTVPTITTQNATNATNTPAVPSKSATPTNGTTVAPKPVHTTPPSIKPTPPSRNATMLPPASVPATPKAAAPRAASGGFSAGSFLGGIVLTLALLAIGYVGCRTYHAKRGVQYRTIDEHDAII